MLSLQISLDFRSPLLPGFQISLKDSVHLAPLLMHPDLKLHFKDSLTHSAFHWGPPDFCYPSDTLNFSFLKELYDR